MPRPDDRDGALGGYSGDSTEYFEASSPDTPIPPPSHALRLVVPIVAAALAVALVSPRWALVVLGLGAAVTLLCAWCLWWLTHSRP